MELHTLAPESMAMTAVSLAALPEAVSAAPRAGTMSCRCPGCGNEVTFDALVVTCACTDETDPSSLH